MNTPDAEFDKFLCDANDSYNRQELFDRQIKIIRNACDDALDYYRVPTGFRHDDARRADARQSFPDAEFSILSDDAVLISQAITAAYTWEINQNDNQSTELKKKLMADIHVQLNAEPGSPWMQFVDGFCHGEPLDFDSIDDLQYIIDAQSLVDERQRNSRDNAPIYVAILKDIYGDDYTTNDEIQFFSIAAMLLLADPNNSVEYSARIDEISRKHTVSREHVVSIDKAIERFLEK